MSCPITEDQKLLGQTYSDYNENRHIVWCDNLQQRRFYGSCLFLKESYSAGRISPEDAHSDCAQAMCKGNCVAYKMRQEEIDAGKVLYFTPRTITENATRVSTSSFAYKRAWNRVGDEIGKTENNFKFAGTKRQATRVVKNTIVATTDYADAINNAITGQEEVSVKSLKKEFMEMRNKNPLKAREIFAQLKQMGVA